MYWYIAHDSHMMSHDLRIRVHEDDSQTLDSAVQYRLQVSPQLLSVQTTPHMQLESRGR